MLSVEEKVNILKTVNIFERTPEHSLTEVAPLLEEMEVPTGEVVFEKGELGDSMYIIVSGRVRVHDEGRTVDYLSEGDVFGEMALLDPEPRSASVVAAEDSNLLRLDEEHFIGLLAKRSEIALGIIRVLLRYLKVRKRHEESFEQAWLETRLSSFL